jgi:hypothetical protein
VIPAVTPFGQGYRVRVNATDPVVTGNNNGTDISINNPLGSGSTTGLVSSNSPVCAGNNLYLEGPFIENAGYSWTGPEGFVYTYQNPAIINATENNSGDYTLVITNDGCVSEPLTTSVIIIPVSAPEIIVNGSSVICMGDYTELSTVTIPEFSYQWQRNGLDIEGATGSAYNAYLSGNYTVTLMAGCGNFISDTVEITVNDPLNGLGNVNLIGLVASFPFNGSADDASGYGNNGIVCGASLTTDRFGIPESAYYFNGLDNYIAHPTDSISATQGTVAGWVNPNDANWFGFW